MRKSRPVCSRYNPVDEPGSYFLWQQLVESAADSQFYMENIATNVNSMICFKSVFHSYTDQMEGADH